MADLRVNVPVTGLYTDPNIVVPCGGRKFEHYRTIPTLNEYLLVAQDRIQVGLYTRQPAGAWLLTSANQLTDTMSLPSIQCSVLLADLYEGLTDFSHTS